MLRSLQAGRGIAALSVAGYHLSRLYAATPGLSGSHLQGVFRHGSTGVDFFFVLSGFIIMLVHRADIGRPERLGAYLRNRAARVYPIYWFYTLLAVLAVGAGISTIVLPSDPAGWLSAVTLVRLTHDAPPLTVVWTLFYEVAFYAIFAILIVNRKAGIAAMAIWVLAIVIFRSKDTMTGVAAVWASRLCLNFFIGMAACWLHSRIGRAIAATALAVGLGILVVALLTVDAHLPETLFGPIVALSFGAIIAGAASLERGRDWAVGPLSGLGNASYTLYLVHEHIQSPLTKLVLHSRALVAFGPDVTFAVTLAATALISWSLYLTVERPLLRLLRNPRRRAPELEGSFG